MHRYTAVISRDSASAADVLSDSFDVQLLYPDKSLADPVSCHADMILFTLGSDCVIPLKYHLSYPELAESLKRLTGCRVITDASERNASYPFDVGLNVLLCGKLAFSLEKHTSPAVKVLLAEQGITHINVKQGYAACSSLAFGGAVVTADESVASAAERLGLEVLRISKGHIRLEGYNEGFIGGASGVCGSRIYFLGNIDSHPDGKKIRAFAEKRGYECISLFDGELCDFGGIKFIENRLTAQR